MTTFKSGGPPPPGYHLERATDGSQVLINDRNGMAAVVDPYSGEITGEVPRAQARPVTPQAPVGGSPRVAPPSGPGQYVPGGAGNIDVSGSPGGASIATSPTGAPPTGGAGGGLPMPGGGGVYPTAPPSSSTPAAEPPSAAPMQGPQVQPGPYDTPGSDLYDWWSVNEAMRGAQMGDGSWNIAGVNHTPVQAYKEVANPAYDKNLDAAENAANGQQPFIQQASNDYIIGVVNKRTGQLVKLHLTRSSPDASGKYSYSVSGRDDLGKLDNTTQPGYKDMQQLALKDGSKELWGTNTATGAFEKMPGAPANLGDLKGWNDVKQIDDGHGHQIWVGTDPTGKPMQPIPGAPTIDSSKYVPGTVKQVTKTVNGAQKQVYVGQNAQTQQWEDIPELGSTPVVQTTTTVGKNVYTTDPNGQLVLATAIAQPKEGDAQWVDAGSGAAKRQVFTNGDWHDDTDTPQKLVSPDLVRAANALPPKGSKLWIPLNGSSDTLIQVTANGNGGYTYDLGPNGESPPVKKIPGARDPLAVTGGSAGDEFLPQRRDPITQALLPPEKNANWQPTSPADRVRQLQQQATDKQQGLHAQVLAGTLSEGDADKQFSQFWDQNIEPAKQELQLAQQYKTVDENRQNLQIAQASVSPVLQAQSNEVRVGPGFGDLMGKISSATGQGKFVGPISGQEMSNALVYDTPDYAQQAEQITANALAHISPTAQQKLGGGTPTALQQPQDITAGLNRGNFQYGGATPGAPAQSTPNPAVATQPVQTTGAPSTPVLPPVPAAAAAPTSAMAPDDWAALQARMQADRAEQLRQSQAQIPNSWNAWGQYKPAF